MNDRSCCLPDFMIVGAPRCGTTALYQYLSSHPHVFMPEEKEPMFFTGFGRTLSAFCPEGVESVYWLPDDILTYTDLFQKASPHQMVSEASTWYLSQHERVIPNIKRMYGRRSGELKVMIMLRNPVERMWSHWSLKRTTGREPLGFESAINPETARQRLCDGFVPSYDYHGFSTYTDAVKAWKDAFPQTQVWIFEEFFADLTSHMEQVMDFLGLSAQETGTWGKVINPSGKPRNRISAGMLRLLTRKTAVKGALKRVLPMRYRRKMKRNMIRLLVKKQAMDPTLHGRLQGHFQEDITRLEQLLGRDLDIWRKGVS